MLSSVHRSFSQKDFGMFRCVLANCSRAFSCRTLRNGVLLGLLSYKYELETDGASWNCRTLCLKVSLNLYGSWLRCFLHHSNNPSLQYSVMFSLAVTSRDVGYSGMGLKPRDNITNGGNRNIKHSFLSFLHAHWGTRSDTKHEKESFSLFQMVTFVIFILQAPATHCRWVQFQSKGESPAWNLTSRRCQ